LKKNSRKRAKWEPSSYEDYFHRDESSMQHNCCTMLFQTLIFLWKPLA
jgi:hypothetical protein